MTQESKNALQKTGPAALERPSFVAEGDARGTENIQREDLQLPRLALAQALSPQLKRNDPKFIEGLTCGDAFNTLTGEVYGRGAIRVVVVRADRPRFVEFNPRSEGGGIKDFSVPAGDPRCAFGPKGEKPIATKFLDFVCWLPDTRETVAVSFKGSGLKAARQLNSLIALRALPSFATVFTLTPVDEKNALGEYAAFAVRQVGNVDEPTYRQCEQLYDAFKDRKLAADESDADHEGESKDVPF